MFDTELAYPLAEEFDPNTFKTTLHEGAEKEEEWFACGLKANVPRSMDSELCGHVLFWNAKSSAKHAIRLSV